MPGDSGATVVTNARVYYTTRAAAGASDTRLSLRPLFSEGQGFLANLGRIAIVTDAGRDAVDAAGAIDEQRECGR